MKQHFPLALALLALLPLGLSTVRAQDGEEEAQRRGLEERVGALEETMSTLEHANAELLRQMGETLRYLEAQAARGQALRASLDESERLGFTAGINPRSKEVLLAALATFHDGQQVDLPQRKAKPDDAR